MAIELVRHYLQKFGKADDIMEFEASSATVALAAEALGCEQAEIAKTLTFRDGESALLVVVSGDAKIDNAKFKNTFGVKAKMLSPEEVLKFTGHEVGGVCPFGLVHPLRVVLDESLKRFDHIYPGCGSDNSMIKLSLAEMEQISGASGWVDVCKLPTYLAE